MFCYSCQAPNRENSLFCTSCGKKLAPPSPGQAAAGNAAIQQAVGGAAPSRPFGGSSNSDRSDGVLEAHSSDAEGWRRAQASGEDIEAGSSLDRHENDWNAAAEPGLSSTQYRPYWPGTGTMLPQPYIPSQALVSTSQSYITCARCGVPRPSRMEKCPGCGRALVNNSGQNAIAPPEVANGWNWGAFLFPVLWSINHETWFGLLALVPGVDIVVRFVLGARGNELAWQNRNFRDVEHYQNVQRAWRNCGIGFAGIMAAFIVLWMFALS